MLGFVGTVGVHLHAIGVPCQSRWRALGGHPFRYWLAVVGRPDVRLASRWASIPSRTLKRPVVESGEVSLSSLRRPFRPAFITFVGRDLRGREGNSRKPTSGKCPATP